MNPVSPHQRWLSTTAVAVCMALVLSGCVTTRALPVAQRPSAWAQPANAAGLPNLHRVSPQLWRSALPDQDGFASADQLGVRTIINLRPAADQPAAQPPLSRPLDQFAAHDPAP